MYCRVLFMLICMLSTSVAAQQRFHVVQRGDSLSKIAKKYYQDPTFWRLIYDANRDIVKQSQLIYPGARLKIPDNSTDASPPPVSQDSQDRPREEIDVVTGNDYQPFSDKKLPEGGLFTEIVRVAFERAGYKPSIEFLPWEYALKSTKKSKFMATFPWFDTEERRKELVYSRPIYEVLILVFFKKNSNLNFQSINDLNGLKVCRPEGYFLDDLKDKIAKKEIIHVAPETPQECFKMVQSGEVDVVSVNDIVGNGIIKELKLEEVIEPSNIAIAIRNLHIVYPRFNYKVKGLKYKVDQAVNDMERDGTLINIVRRHLERYYESLEKESKKSR